MAKVFQYDKVPSVQTKSGLIKVTPLTGYISSKVFPTLRPEVSNAHGGRTLGGSQGSNFLWICQSLLKQDTPSVEIMIPHRYWPEDENCQNLNIWTKSLDREAKRPVLVWFHDWGFVAGSAIEHIT